MMNGKKIIAGCCIAGAAILLAGACSPQPDGRNDVLVAEVYIVKSGDTLWTSQRRMSARIPARAGISSSTRAASRKTILGCSNATG